MGADVYEAYLYALEGSCVKIPTKTQADEGKTVFLSMNSPATFAEEAAKLASLGFTLVGSPGTAKALRLRGVPIQDIPDASSDWAPAAHLGVPSCGGAFTPSMRLVSISP